MAKKVCVNPSLRIFVIIGHTAKDSRRPITDVGEFHFVDIVFIIYYDDICTQYFPKNNIQDSSERLSSDAG